VTEPGLGLAGRAIVVAGAGGGGIGTATCQFLAESGAVVVAVDRDPDRLAEVGAVVGGVGGRVLVMRADVGDEAQVERLVDDAVAQLGRIDGLVHVVGGLGASWQPLVDTTADDFDDVLRLNLGTAVVTTRLVARQLVAQGTGGAIVHIASLAGLTSMPFGVAYGAAKAGLLSLTRTAAVELGRHGVRVNAVAAGTVRTPAAAANASGRADDVDRWPQVPLGRRADPRDIASAVAFLLSDLAAFAVDGGSSAKPSYLDDDDLPVFVLDPELRQRLTGRT
jgi:NAD(P)-dependent dehydrogenase (short-subunit alcohol dehydrogenase family)